MRQGVHRAITHSRDIVLLLKPIVLQLMPKMASSTTSKTYVEDVDLNGFTSNPKPDPWGVLASHPCLRPRIFIAVRERFITFCFNKNLIKIIIMLCDTKHNLCFPVS